MTRVIAGLARGRRLRVPAGTSTRPTSDRAREGLWNSVVAARGGLSGLRVLDLYAGSGALGLEALSRGAEQVVLVDSDPAAAAAITANIAAVGLPGARLLRQPVERLVAAPPPVGEGGTRERVGPFDVVVVDAPYAMSAQELRAVLELAAGSGWLAQSGDVVVERSRRDEDWLWPSSFTALRGRRYGEAVLWYGRC